MNSPAHDLALYLVAAGVMPNFGGAIPWSAFIAAEPDTPDETVTFYDLPGGEPDTDEMDQFTPAFQVRVRAKLWVEGYAKQEAIRDALLSSRSGFEAESSRFILVVMTSDIATIGRDDKQRHLIVANYRARREAKE